METAQTLSPVRPITTPRIRSAAAVSAERVYFFDMVRDVAMIAVVIYHAVGAYASVAPYWGVHDGVSVIANGIRELFDVFMMPVFFFVAGYFALSSLQRKGAGTFLKGKFRELGFPWLLGTLLLIPIAQHEAAQNATTNGASIPFWRFWLDYLQQIGQLQVAPRSGANQLHFWFVSLLLVFFIGFVLWRRMARPVGGKDTAATVPTTAPAIIKTLIGVSLLASLGSFAVVLFIPSAAWVKLDLLLEFQAVSLILYIAYFVLGIMAANGQWFAHHQFPGRLAVWVPLGLVLMAAFLVLGEGEFTYATTGIRSSPLVLLAFATVRTFLCLAFLVTLLSLSMQYASGPSKWVQNLSYHSYNIYLVHIFFVAALQDTLVMWAGGPPLAKAALITLVALPLSYGTSKLIKRFPYVVIGLVLMLFVAKFIGSMVSA